MSTPTPDAETAGGGKKKIIIVLVLALAAAAGAWWFLMGPGGSDKKEEPVPGVVMELEPITVNLAGGGYLKVGLALQLTEDAAAHGEPSGAKALDLAIAEFSQADPTEVTDHREKIKKRLEKKIVEAYHHTVIEIFLTSYVSQ